MNTYFFCRHCGRLSSHLERTPEDNVCPHCASTDLSIMRIVRVEKKKGLPMQLLEASLWLAIIVLAMIGAGYLLSQW